ncbi:MAG TPA: hypothetical protein VH143_34585 [Kofleriaceae bacterium]|jgi:hypothetical protein|nr:hypothetical protein [Kofleriaceae bacterium]
MRTPLFGEEPVHELRGLAALSDPDDPVAAVIDLPILGARGDGKTQFIVHAIRALRAHTPALIGAEQAMNREVMRAVLDPRSPRPDATPPGAVPHFTFRVRGAGLMSRLGALGALRLFARLGALGALVFGAVVAAVGAVLAVVARAGAAGWLLAACGVLVGLIAIVRTRHRLAQLGDVEIVFWDVAGEQVYSAAAADYYALLGSLVDARRRRAHELGRSYAFAPVLICNPLALGTLDSGSPYERLRELLPLFAAHGGDPRALVAINRWSVVDPICTRGAPRDEIVAVTACAHGEPATPPHEVARDIVRSCCLDVESGRDGDVRVDYLRYDTAMRASVTADDGKLTYDYEEGPGAFNGPARARFLSWLVGMVRFDRAAVAPIAAAEPTPLAIGSIAPIAKSPYAPPEPIAASATATTATLEPVPEQVWARPR